MFLGKKENLTNKRYVNKNPNISAINKSMAIIEFSPEGIILGANENFLNTMGYEENEIIGQHHEIFCIPEYAQSEDYEVFWQTLREGAFFKNRFQRIDKEGYLVWLEASC